MANCGSTNREVRLEAGFGPWMANDLIAQLSWLLTQGPGLGRILPQDKQDYYHFTHLVQLWSLEERLEQEVGGPGVLFALSLLPLGPGPVPELL